MTLTPSWRRFTVQRLLSGDQGGGLTEDDRVKLIDRELIIAPPAFPEWELDGVELLG